MALGESVFLEGISKTKRIFRWSNTEEKSVSVGLGSEEPQHPLYVEQDLQNIKNSPIHKLEIMQTVNRVDVVGAKEPILYDILL